jgi:hypothetical protein
MLITVTGRKSGRRYTIPVSYYEVDGTIVILVAEARGKQWWRNYRTPGPLGLHLRGKASNATAQSLPPTSPDFKRLAEAVFRRARFVPGIFGVDFDVHAGLTAAQLEQLSREAAVVKVTK